jgi:hypothetical protein
MKRRIAKLDDKTWHLNCRAAPYGKIIGSFGRDTVLDFTERKPIDDGKTIWVEVYGTAEGKQGKSDSPIICGWVNASHLVISEVAPNEPVPGGPPVEPFSWSPLGLLWAAIIAVIVGLVMWFFPA